MLWDQKSRNERETKRVGIESVVVVWSLNFSLDIGDRLSVKSGLLGSVGTTSDHVGNDSECHYCEWYPSQVCSSATILLHPLSSRKSGRGPEIQRERDIQRVPPALTWIPSEVPPWTLTDSTKESLAMTAVQIAAPLLGQLIPSPFPGYQWRTSWATKL